MQVSSTAVTDNIALLINMLQASQQAQAQVVEKLVAVNVTQELQSEQMAITEQIIDTYA